MMNNPALLHPAEQGTRALHTPYLKQKIVYEPLGRNWSINFTHDGRDGMIFVLASHQITKESVKLDSTFSVNTSSH